jgi:hypothetical protein
VLLAEGREETNWNKAREAYNDVQKSIVRGEQLELYDDVERLLPDHIKPECLEMVMDIEEYDRSTAEKSREKARPWGPVRNASGTMIPHETYLQELALALSVSRNF